MFIMSILKCKVNVGIFWQLTSFLTPSNQLNFLPLVINLIWSIPKVYFGVYCSVINTEICCFKAIYN